MKQLLHLRNFAICLFALLLFTASAHATGDVSVYPNPSTEKISLRYLPENANAVYVITAITGNVVRQGTLNATSYTTIAVDDLPGGIYLVNITDGNNVFTTKFIRQ
jgi:hypothetical protein